MEMALEDSRKSSFARRSLHINASSNQSNQCNRNSDYNSRNINFTRRQARVYIFI